MLGSTVSIDGDEAMMEESQLYERVDRLDRLFPEIARRFRTIPSQPHRTPDLSIPQLRTLLLLESEQGHTMGELARLGSVTMPTATASVDALVAGRYASRRRSRQDRRVVLVSLTAKGRRTLEGFRKERRERTATILRHLSAEDQERFVQAFEDIVEILRKLDEAEPSEPPRRRDA